MHGADTAGLNLARHLADGEQIVVGIATPAGRRPALGSSWAPRPRRRPPPGQTGRSDRPQHRHRGRTRRAAGEWVRSPQRPSSPGARRTAGSPASTSSARSTASAPAGWRSCGPWFGSDVPGGPIRRAARPSRADRLAGDRRWTGVGPRAVAGGDQRRPRCGVVDRCTPRPTALSAGPRPLLPECSARRWWAPASASRSRCVASRSTPIRYPSGSAPSWVTVTPQDSPRRAGPARVMFRANLIRLGDSETDATVTVFGPGVDFGRLSPGQPARFRARDRPAKAARPHRRVLTAVGQPSLGRAPPIQRVAQAIRGPLRRRRVRCFLPTRPPCSRTRAGDTSAIPAATTEDFRTAGLTHLTAVSGANVTIVCGGGTAVGASGRSTGSGCPRRWPWWPSWWWCSPARVLRAAIMAAIGLMALLFGRRRQAIPVLAATVVALMLWSPQLASTSASRCRCRPPPPWWCWRRGGRSGLVGRGGQAGRRCGVRGAGGPTRHRSTDCGHRRTVQPGVGPRESCCGGSDSADHRARHRGRDAGVFVDAAGRPADQVHRAGGVVAVAGRHSCGWFPGRHVPVPSGWAGFVTVAVAGGVGGAVAVAPVPPCRLRGGAVLAAWSVSGLVGGRVTPSG